MKIASKCLGIAGGQIAVAMSFSLMFMSMGDASFGFFGIFGITGGILGIIGGFFVGNRNRAAVWLMGIGSVCCMLSTSALASIPLTIGAVFAHYCDIKETENADEDDADEEDA